MPQTANHSTPRGNEESVYTHKLSDPMLPRKAPVRSFYL